MMLVDLVSRSPVAVRPEASVLEAARLMRERKVGSVVVVDEGGSVAGILTDRDIAMAIADGRFSGVAGPVGEIMTREPVCLPSHTDIERGLAAMRGRGVRRMPVLNDAGELIGVVSLDDIVIHMGRSMGEAADLVRDETKGRPEDAWPAGR
jgi:CBS domain-containing protein